VDLRPPGAERIQTWHFATARNTAEHDSAEVEAEIREFVRRDVVTNRERQPENESDVKIFFIFLAPPLEPKNLV
jgi:hypothetical protein